MDHSKENILNFFIVKRHCHDRIHNQIYYVLKAVNYENSREQIQTPPISKLNERMSVLFSLCVHIWWLKLKNFGVRFARHHYLSLLSKFKWLNKAWGDTCLDFGYGRSAGIPGPHPIHILGEVKKKPFIYFP